MMDRLSLCFKQVILVQVIILVFCSSATVVLYDLWPGLAVAFGVVLALTNTLLSKRSIQRASKIAYSKPQMSMLPVFSGLMQRLIVFAAGFAAGVLWLGLLPLPLLMGFGLAQLGYLACNLCSE